MKFYLQFLFICFGTFVNAQLSELYTVSKLKISQAALGEYNLQVSNNKGYFVSNLSNDKISKVTDQNYNSLNSIYYSNNIDAILESPTKLPIQIRKHIGTFSISSSEDEIYFTAESNLNPKKFAIYHVKKLSGKWSEPKEVMTDSKVNFLDPFLSKSGDTLYFASDLQGGYGGLDIYYAVWSENEWKNFKNLGNVINSAYNERYPNKITNTLSFSSNRNGNHDNLDIYTSAFKNQNWMTTYRLPSPVNTDFDEFALTQSENGIWYFSSSRDGSDDLFQMNFQYPEFDCNEYVEPDRCFEFFESNAGFEDSSQFSFQWNMGDGTKYNGLEASHCYADSGMYLIELNVVDKKTNEVFYNQASYEFLIEDPYQLQLLVSDSIFNNLTQFKVNQAFNADSSKMFWDLDDGNIYYGNNIEHKYTATGNYLVKVGQIYYRDGQKFSVCTSKNFFYSAGKPSNERNDSIRFAQSENYLRRLKESISQDDETEIKYLLEIISSQDDINLEDAYFDKLRDKYLIEKRFDAADQKYSYSVGNENKATDLYETFTDIKALGYEDAKVIDRKFVTLFIENLDTVQSKTLEYAIIEIPPIQFKSNSFEVPPSSFENLDILADFMLKFPEIKMEIRAHTDNVGRPDKNLILSDYRAKAIAKYLENKNISGKRIVTEGLGDSKPLASNVDEKGRSANRRVEFRVLK